MDNDTIDRKLAQIAAPQAGAFRVEQAFACGITAEAIAWRVHRGSAYRRHPRTYVLGHPGANGETDVWAAVLAAGPEADVRKLLDVERLRSTMQRNIGRRGAGRLKLALAKYLDGDNGVDNRAAELFTRMLRRAGVHDATNNKVLSIGGERVRPDVWIESVGLAVELDERSHTLAPVMREDRLKEALLRSADIPFLRVDDRDLETGVNMVLEYVATHDPTFPRGFRT